MRRGLSWHLYAVLLVVASIALTVSAFFAKNEEYAYEMADLQAMHAARSTAEKMWKDSLPEAPVEYWYDGGSFVLVPADGAMPAPCGVGTGRSGGAKRDFERKTNMSVENYNESESYRGKLPSVTVSEEGGELNVSVCWIEAE